jgi:hypothetical protein
MSYSFGVKAVSIQLIMIFYCQDSKFAAPFPIFLYLDFEFHVGSMIFEFTV